jgi:hypothetical protein
MFVKSVSFREGIAKCKFALIVMRLDRRSTRDLLNVLDAVAKASWPRAPRALKSAA